MTKPTNWRKRYWHKPHTYRAVEPDHRTLGRREREYCTWLAAQRGLEYGEAREYAMRQPWCGLVSSHFDATDFEAPAKVRRPNAKAVAKRVLAFLASVDAVPPDLLADLKGLAA